MRIRQNHFLSNMAGGAPKFLYLGSILRTFGYSFLGILGHVFLFKVFQSYGFSETTAFAFVVLRQSAIYGLKLLTLIPVSKLVEKVGAKTLLVIGPALSAISISLYALSQYNLFWLIPNVLLLSFEANIYWVPYHTVFSSKNDLASIGKQMGVLKIMGSVISVVTPALSAFVIQSFGGFNVSFAVSFLLFTLSSVALYAGELDLSIGEIRLSDFKKEYGKEKRLFPDYMVIGMENIIQNVVWGIFIYLFIDDVLKLGLLTSAISLALALFTFFIGKLSDEKKVGGIDKFSAVFNGIIWIGKLFVQNGLHIFFLDSLFSLFRTAYAVPIDVIVYSDAKHENPIWPVILREAALDIGRSVTALVVALLIFMRYEYWVIFMLASIGYLALGFLLKDNES